jgi:TRAP-type C4-dicarboxylate transport system permease small subunit
LSAALDGEKLEETRPADIPTTGLLGLVQTGLSAVNAVLVAVSALAIGGAGCVLTWEVAGRYFFKIPSDWQDELSVFLLVGAAFCSAGWVQARRGHVGIEALAHVLPAGADRVRRILADLVSLAFCSFFCWKCWALLQEAWEDGQTSQSAWGPPLSIPYGLMALGTSVLVAQLALQTLDRLSGSRRT